MALDNMDSKHETLSWATGGHLLHQSNPQTHVLQSPPNRVDARYSTNHRN